MALKRKITKEEYDALDPIIQAEYKGSGAGYVLDTDNDDSAVDEIRRALDHSRADTAAERAAKKALQDRVDEIDRQLAAGELTTAEANKDIARIKELMTNERESLRTELTGKITARETQLRNLLLTGRAESLARELAGDRWKIILPHITTRLTVDLSADDPKLSVLSADGQPSTLSLADLKQEFLQNADFASIIVGSKSSGGGAGGNSNGSGATKKPEDYTEAERVELFRNNRPEFDRLFSKR